MGPERSDETAHHGGDLRSQETSLLGTGGISGRWTYPPADEAADYGGECGGFGVSGFEGGRGERGAVFQGAGPSGHEGIVCGCAVCGSGESV